MGWDGVSSEMDVSYLVPEVVSLDHAELPQFPGPHCEGQSTGRINKEFVKLFVSGHVWSDTERADLGGVTGGRTDRQ